MHYTLHQLKIFLKICELKSITNAAKALHLTQPAVSIQLKRLQDQFEIPLTEVMGRQLYVTDFGKEIARVSQNVLKEAENIKNTVDSYKGILSGKIKISVVSTGKYIIPYFLQPFMEKYPGVEIAIDVSNKKQVIDGLSKNESDFSLVSIIPDALLVNTITLMENQLYFIGSEKFDSKEVSLKTLEQLTLIFREEGSATRNAMKDYFSKNDLSNVKSMELVSNEAVKQAVNAGIGFSIMPLIGLKNELKNRSLKIFPLKGLPIVTNWNLIYNKNKKLSPASIELVRFIKEYKEQIVKEHFAWDIPSSKEN